MTLAEIEKAEDKYKFALEYVKEKANTWYDRAYCYTPATGNKDFYNGKRAAYMAIQLLISDIEARIKGEELQPWEGRG